MPAGAQAPAGTLAGALDRDEFPNFAEVLATRAGLDFDRRFETTLHIPLSGYAALP